MATSPQPPDESSQSFSIEYEQEADGRWLAEVPTLPGVMACGKTKQDAEVGVTALALRVIADRTEQGESLRNRSGFREHVAEQQSQAGVQSTPPDWLDG